jgi:hypothetical protein
MKSLPIHPEGNVVGSWTRRGVLAGVSAATGAAARSFLLLPQSDPGPAFPAELPLKMALPYLLQ